MTNNNVRIIARAITYAAMSDLSIVIPTFNTASMTLRCCRAVLASMPESTEVIVADDGSTDGTAELLAREVPAVRVVRLASNRGFAPAANRGVSDARGRIILLLNSDAVIETSALPAILSAFAADPALGVAGAQLLNADGSLQWSGGRTPTLPWMIGVVSGAGPLARFFRRRKPAAGEREVDWVSGAAMAFRREVWEAAGPLDEQYRFYCQDIAFCLAARRCGWPVRIIPDVRVIHALGGTIGGDSTLRYDPEKLWPDLLQWSAAHYGRRWASRARMVLLGIAWLRIAWRKLRRRDDATAALVRAVRTLFAQSDS
jgi:N-acetylglucosaminyl-diphospho-decaprenol L-rhamnosyltransferase